MKKARLIIRHNVNHTEYATIEAENNKALESAIDQKLHILPAVPLDIRIERKK
jgi:hypothetical protein